MPVKDRKVKLGKLSSKLLREEASYILRLYNCYENSIHLKILTKNSTILAINCGKTIIWDKNSLFWTPHPPCINVFFSRLARKQLWNRGEGGRGGQQMFGAFFTFLPLIYGKDCLNSQKRKKKLNREAPHMKISKSEKSKSILLQFASWHLHLHMTKTASIEMRGKFILTSIKMRKFSCIFTQHQNKLSEREKD